MKRDANKDGAFKQDRPESRLETRKLFRRCCPTPRSKVTADAPISARTLRSGSIRRDEKGEREASPPDPRKESLAENWPDRTRFR